MTHADVQLRSKRVLSLAKTYRGIDDHRHVPLRCRKGQWKKQPGKRAEDLVTNVKLSMPGCLLVVRAANCINKRTLIFSS
jgi:hypothetical protein